MTSFLRNLAIVSLAILATGFAAAQSGVKDAEQPAAKNAAPDGGVPAEHHPWGRFPIGSWEVTRVSTANLDPLGSVTGTTVAETRTPLIAADASTYTLKYQVTTEASGKRFVGKPQTRVLGYN